MAKESIHYRPDEEVVKRLDQLVQHAEIIQKGKNRSEVLTSLINETWARYLGQHKIEVANHTLYFLSEEDKATTTRLLDDYQAKGMQIDNQMVDYIREKTHAYCVEND